MAANVENRPNEKDASLQSSVAGGQHVAARNLDERRRSALAHIDNASFSSVKKKLLFSTLMLKSIVCSWFHVKICAVAGVGFFTDA
jgi:PHS family inorganic phosphate transporter-like MFS transporter